jgi:large subunit ribosomal protein L18
MRLSLLRSGKPRIVVRRSLNNFRVQIITYSEQGDTIVASAMGSDLKKSYKWKHSMKNTSAAYLTGLLAGKRAKDAGVSEGVLDIGRQVPANGAKVFAALRGILDAGIAVPHSGEKLPSDDRIMGKHLDDSIAKDVTSLKEKIIGGK